MCTPAVPCCRGSRKSAKVKKLLRWVCVSTVDESPSRCARLEQAERRAVEAEEDAIRSRELFIEHKTRADRLAGELVHQQEIKEEAKAMLIGAHAHVHDRRDMHTTLRALLMEHAIALENERAHNQELQKKLVKAKSEYDLRLGTLQVESQQMARAHNELRKKMESNDVVHKRSLDEQQSQVTELQGTVERNAQAHRHHMERVMLDNEKSVKEHHNHVKELQDQLHRANKHLEARDARVAVLEADAEMTATTNKERSNTMLSGHVAAMEERQREIKALKNELQKTTNEHDEHITGLMIAHKGELDEQAGNIKMFQVEREMTAGAHEEQVANIVHDQKIELEEQERAIKVLQVEHHKTELMHSDQIARLESAHYAYVEKERRRSEVHEENLAKMNSLLCEQDARAAELEDDIRKAAQKHDELTDRMRTEHGNSVKEHLHRQKVLEAELVQMQAYISACDERVASLEAEVEEKERLYGAHITTLTTRLGR